MNVPVKLLVKQIPMKITKKEKFRASSRRNRVGLNVKNHSTQVFFRSSWELTKNHPGPHLFMKILFKKNVAHTLTAKIWLQPAQQTRHIDAIVMTGSLKIVMESV